MPASARHHGLVIEAAPNWSFDPGILSSEADVVVWGRTSDGSSPLRLAARSALARELTLGTLRHRTGKRLHLAGSYRLRPNQLARSGIRNRLRAALRSGAMVEFTSLPSGSRILDVVASDAGAAHTVNDVHLCSGGGVVAEIALTNGVSYILRLQRAGSLGDPARLADTLEFLNAVGVSLAPLLHSRGQTSGASWTVEQLLPGKRPEQVTPSLALQVAEVCARFPRAECSPTSLAADLHGVAKLLPQWGGALDRLAVDLASTVEKLPGVLRHGDLWAGNLLIDRDQLTGLVDWDAAHPAAVPGADLLQLFATEARRMQRLALGPAFLTHPWRLDKFKEITGPYWRSLRIRPTSAMLEAIGLAWWITEVHGTLTRLPHRVSDERWVSTNVDSVLTSLGY